MRIASRSDVGRIRSVNEDRTAVLPDCAGFVVGIVADGMGGHQAGDLASQMAIEAIQQELRSTLTASMTEQECGEALRLAIQKANQAVYAFAQGKEQYNGMGTTVVAAIASADRLVIANIGDSRAYLADSEGFRQVTEDHSLVNVLFRTGQITEEEAKHHPRKNILMRALGTDDQVEIDLFHRSWSRGDMLLLCSDGLSGSVGSEQLNAILRGEDEFDRKADRLVQAALEAGGEDNITVVLLINEPGLPEGMR
ncbi:serine/threonine phosphatase stp [Paenibacillus sp. J31TS4]|uniref:Stp1/IreP family PP2C-type Ser/Thr phosphatase n=1 Tax=Paenibacillus sp. J31TS4 TaxID=2807195 RepID=UPI001B2EFD88|nr:Stp1/IreP family PP2C-type Ser/Thr phosphatase [Paenibacillus sp. J31TS4]GIP36737.1 serine/threonine phosphatase stp [Paenibacillus sp. J31TS4]